jgi:hypothetical protein
MHFGFTKEELRLLRSLNTPRKIQDFLDTLRMNFEENGETNLSPRKVLQERHAHCMEGAMLAATALRLAGWKPLVMDLKANGKDFDNVETTPGRPAPAPISIKLVGRSPPDSP